MYQEVHNSNERNLLSSRSLCTSLKANNTKCKQIIFNRNTLTINNFHVNNFLLIAIAQPKLKSSLVNFLLERKTHKIIQQSTYTDRKVKRQLYQSILLTIMSNTEEKTHSDLLGISHIILCIQPPHRQLRYEVQNCLNIIWAEKSEIFFAISKQIQKDENMNIAKTNFPNQRKLSKPNMTGAANVN